MNKAPRITARRRWYVVESRISGVRMVMLVQRSMLKLKVAYPIEKYNFYDRRNRQAMYKVFSSCEYAWDIDPPGDS